MRICRFASIIVVAGCSFFMNTEAHAVQVNQVCRGEFQNICNEHPGFNIFESCSVDSHSSATCLRYCGVTDGPRCSITKSFERDGNHCGYVWIYVRCFP